MVQCIAKYESSHSGRVRWLLVADFSCPKNVIFFHEKPILPLNFKNLWGYFRIFTLKPDFISSIGFLSLSNTAFHSVFCKHALLSCKIQQCHPPPSSITQVSSPLFPSFFLCFLSTFVPLPLIFSLVLSFLSISSLFLTYSFFLFLCFLLKFFSSVLIFIFLSSVLLVYLNVCYD